MGWHYLMCARLDHGFPFPEDSRKATRSCWLPRMVCLLRPAPSC